MKIIGMALICIFDKSSHDYLPPQRGREGKLLDQTIIIPRIKCRLRLKQVEIFTFELKLAFLKIKGLL